MATLWPRGNYRRPLFKEQEMGGLTYSGKFEEHINELYSPQNISKTAKKFKEYEKKNGPYAFGKFTKFLVPKKENWASESGSTDGHDRWEKHSGAIPKAVRDKITEVIATNLRSPNPMPLVLKVGENVDGTHDLKVRIFAHNGHMHIGLHMLCPNSSLK
jgi:hypothetical protein